MHNIHADVALLNMSLYLYKVQRILPGRINISNYLIRVMAIDTKYEAADTL